MVEIIASITVPYQIPPGKPQALSMDNYTCTFNELGICKEGTIRANKAELKVRNSILSGVDNDEIKLVDVFEGKQQDMFQFNISNSVIRVKENLQNDYFNERIKDVYILQNLDRLYANENKSDYRLDSISVAKYLAMPIPTIPDDLPGNIRKTDKSDAGCYEYLD